MYREKKNNGVLTWILAANDEKAICSGKYSAQGITERTTLGLEKFKSERRKCGSASVKKSGKCKQ